MTLHVHSHDGCIVQCPNWQSWRKFTPLHTRRPCRSCEGTGEQSWMIEASGGKKTRWFTEPCRTCKGKGYKE